MKKPIDENRIGFIVFHDQVAKEMWDIFSTFFKDFRPTHIEFRHWENDKWYFYGVSNLFEPVKEGEATPRYELIFHQNGKGKPKYEVYKELK